MQSFLDGESRRAVTGGFEMKQAPPNMFYVAKATQPSKPNTSSAAKLESGGEGGTENALRTADSDGEEEGPGAEAARGSVERKTTYHCLRGPGVGVYAGRPKRKALAAEKARKEKSNSVTRGGDGARNPGTAEHVAPGADTGMPDVKGTTRGGGGAKEESTERGLQGNGRKGSRQAPQKRRQAGNGTNGAGPEGATGGPRRPKVLKQDLKAGAAREEDRPVTTRKKQTGFAGAASKDAKCSSKGKGKKKAGVALRPEKTTRPRSKRQARSNSKVKGVATAERDIKAGKAGKQRKGKRRTTARDFGDGFRVGCACRFVVVSYRALPDLVEVRLLEQQHRNHCTATCLAAGCVHFPQGVDGRRSLGKLAHLAPRLSEGCRAFVRQLLAQYPGIRNREVIGKVREWSGAGTGGAGGAGGGARGEAGGEVGGEAGGGAGSGTARERHVHTRDMGITGKDVQNIRREVEKAAYQLAADPAQSVDLFTQREPEKVFLYRQQVVADPEIGNKGGLEKEDGGLGALKEEKIDQLQSFHLGLCTPWQREMLEKHGRTACLDSTFGVNDLAFPLFTVLVIDGHWHGIPVAWDLMSGQTTDDIVLMLTNLKSRCPGWQPEVFIVDDCRAEINAIQQVFPQAEIILCDFHVKKTFIKQIIAKVTGRPRLTEFFLNFSAISCKF